ncbi:MAG: sulfatase-like hydrolase/transferase [Actinobacteria bacterium]|nr:sulfatase-like hydrolase/transferase [Actinomycetota bacterium]
MATRPNVLVIMTDEERYPPLYEDDELAEFRRVHLPARERLRATSIELHRHYAASTACLPSRASLFTGQYPSLHGVTNTDGLAKGAKDPAMRWLDPATVPTMGDWFRSAGYRSYYRGKWHISHPDLLDPVTHHGLATNDKDGNVDQAVVELYRRADRLDIFGFTGWIGREPHGANPADTGYVRDPIFADQVCELFDELDGDDTPWLAIASFVNPHDIAFSGAGWQLLGMPEVDGTVPPIPPAPSQDDSFDGRPRAQKQFHDVWPKLLYEQPADELYRRFYLWLHKVVDVAIARVLDRLAASPAADNTIVVFTSDHGDMLGAHGGMQQKWHTAFDEATRVPMLVSGPGIAPSAGGAGVSIPTSHVDLLPTLLGLARIDHDAARASVAEHHVEAQPLPGRDLSPLLLGKSIESSLDEPIYFMTEDCISSGLVGTNRFTGAPFDPVEEPNKVESVIATLGDGTLWKLNRYYQRLADWEREHGVETARDEPAASEWELYDLTNDPEERTNVAGTADELTTAQRLLDDQREAKRLVPEHRNVP